MSFLYLNGQVNIEHFFKVEVPVYFCVGRYDYNTPFELIEKYYYQLVAPKNGLRNQLISHILKNLKSY